MHDNGYSSGSSFHEESALMFPNDLHYNFPSAAYLLFAVIILFSLFWRLYFYRGEVLKRFAPPNLLQEILIQRSRYNYWAKVIAISIAWILATFALMQPKGNGHYPLESSLEAAKKPKGEEKEAIIKRKAHDVIFLIDASASMGVEDTRTKISRLDYSKEIVDEVISRLKGESVALYAFTSDTTKLSPPTLDYIFTRLMLRQVGINEGDIAGTNVIEAIADMRDEYFKTITPKLKTLIVLTDGGDTQLEGVKGLARENQIRSILTLLDNAEENQLRVFTVGMGTEQGKKVPNIEYQGKPVISSLDEDLLERISKYGRGAYYFSNDWTSMNLAEDLIKKMGEDKPLLEEYKIKSRKAVTKGEEDLVYDLFFQIPLGIAMLLLGFAIFFPATRIFKKE